MNEMDRLKKNCSADVLALNRDLFEAAPAAQPRRNKYNARKITVDGEVFDSKKEYLRYRELTMLQSTGQISGLQRQVKYVLQAAITDGAGHKQRAITYAADFVYQMEGKTVIEDVKSVATAKSESFRVRWRMLLNQFKDDPSVTCLLSGLD